MPVIEKLWPNPRAPGARALAHTRGRRNWQFAAYCYTTAASRSTLKGYHRPNFRDPDDAVYDGAG